ncbi:MULTISPECIES: hypothetical protein [unclassified Mesorhizobium]|uniref:hypothetical protein n=1 Tax=unclassified Mesorhizobium TaxID=325217 RepID=UPI001FF06305|nr:MULTISPECIES: hypothetical protein [unclassified Mesorhizobium]
MSAILQLPPPPFEMAWPQTSVAESARAIGCLTNQLKSRDTDLRAGYFADMLCFLWGFAPWQVLKWKGKSMAKESTNTASSEKKADANLIGNAEGNGLNFLGVQARENGGPADAVGVDKIRDLLFGNQMQDYDRRFSKLEERVLQRFKDVESEAKRNLEMYESNAKKQIDSLAGQLRTEKDSRADADKEIDRNLREQNQALEKQVRALSDQLSALERDVSDRINRNDHSLREEIKQKNEGVQMLIEKMFADLSNVKTDRNLLAGLFVEVAKALNQDPVGSKGNSDRSWKVS